MSRMWVLYLASLMLRSWGIGALAWLLTFRMRSVVRRHAVWVAVLAIMLAMPIVDAVLPSALVPIPIQTITTQPPPVLNVLTSPPIHVPTTAARTASPVANPQHRFDYWQLALGLYVIATLFLLVRLVYAWSRVCSVRDASQTISLPLIAEVAAAHGLESRVPRVCESADARVPLTIGLFQPLVLLPAEWKTWDEWKLRAVLLHEFAHIRRRDWLVAAAAAFNKSLFALNPLAWWIERHMSTLSEQACDEASLRFDGDAARYAKVLLEFASSSNNGQRLEIGVVPMAGHRIRSRIERILTIQHAESAFASARTWIIVFVLAVPVLYAASAIHAAEPPVTMPGLTLKAPAVPAPQQDNAATAIQEKAPERNSYRAMAARIQEAERNVEAVSRRFSDDQNGLLEVLRQQLSDIERQNAELSATYTRDHPMRKRLEQESDELRNQIEAEMIRLNAIDEQRPRASISVFNVTVTGAKDRTVFLKTGDHEFSYGCADCTFLVSMNRVSADDDGAPGLLIHLKADGKNIDLTCRTSGCFAPIQTGNELKTLSLGFNESAVLPLSRSLSIALVVPN